LPLESVNIFFLILAGNNVYETKLKPVITSTSNISNNESLSMLEKENKRSMMIDMLIDSVSTDSYDYEEQLPIEMEFFA